MRYGDDFIVIEPDLGKLVRYRTQTTAFLNNELKLQVNPKGDKIVKTRRGLKLLGIKFWSKGRTLTKRNLSRTRDRLKPDNISCYGGLIKKHGNAKQLKRFTWLVYERFLADF